MKKLLALLLSALMVLSMTTNVFAEGISKEDAVIEEEAAESIGETDSSWYGNITSQPEDVTVSEGETAEFKVEVTGSVWYYQWQVSKNNGKKWTNLSTRTYGASDTLRITAKEDYDGYLYRCIVTFGLFRVETSQAAKLNIKAQMPAFDDEKSAGTSTVSVNVPEGALPEGTELSVSTADLDAAKAAIEGASRANSAANVVLALDISFGEGVEPAEGSKVQVTITDEALKNLTSPALYHITDDGLVEKVENVVVEDGKLSFEAESFSVYVVVDEGFDPNARATVNFYGADGNVIATYYVKNSDVILGDGERDNSHSYLEDIVVDPGVGTIPSGQLFRGWSVDDLMDSEGTRYTDSETYVGSAYTTATTPMTIELVREYLEALEIKEGDIVNIYPMIFKYFSVTYYGLDEGISLGSDIVILMTDAEEASYTVNMAFTAESNAKFMGWKADDETYSNIEGATADNRTYDNNTVITITGDVVFNVVAPTGHWLVYNERYYIKDAEGNVVETGKGATFNAPEFYLDNVDTVQPSNATAEYMKCLGYTFGGWYYGTTEEVTIGEGDSAKTVSVVTLGSAFSFGSPLTEVRTDIYAKWIANATAPYTVLIWKQNADRDGYDFAASYVGTGNVGASIVSTAITTGTTGDLTYATIGGTKYGGITSVSSGTTTDPFTGFTLSGTAITDAKIKAEGDAVVNVYFDRVQYTLRFYVTRTNSNGTGDYQGASSYSSSGQYGGNWTDRQAPGLDYITKIGGSAPTTYSTVGNYRYYYYSITAYYGDDISNLWPVYTSDQGTYYIESSTSFVSWILMPTAKAATGTSSGAITVKGTIGIMNEQVLGNLSDSDGNYLTARYSTANNWIYYIYMADENGDYPSSPTSTMILKSADSNGTQQHAPAFDGYINDTAQSGNNATGSTTISGTSYYTKTYYYKRLTYTINFMDGSYVGGNGELNQNRATVQLSSTGEIPYGEDVSSYNTYKATLPEGQSGYLFEGWYMDEGCNSPYTFDTMPIGGITVYAKWRIIQYRVFLHPNADTKATNPDLYWGRDDQAMNFRISFGEKVSTPHGIWTNGIKEFVAWFTDEDCTNVFDGDVVVLNENTVSKSYDKTTDFTDDMDQWGNGATYNKDTERWWITKKLDLYAKWRTVLIGADGITVVYNAEDTVNDVNGTVSGSQTYTDELIYLDASDAVATGGAVPADDDYQFLYWVVQRWNGTAYEDVKVDSDIIAVFPGDSFTVLAEYAKITDKNGNPVTTTTAGESYTYTLQLRAEYGPKETPADTYVNWYLNEECEEFEAPIYTDTDKQINQLIPLHDLATDESITVQRGHVFLGWAIQTEFVQDENGNYLDAEGNITTDEKKFVPISYHEGLTADDLDLKYNAEDGNYYTQSTTKAEDGTETTTWVKAKGVAADNMHPYMALYAVWKDVIYIVHGATGTVEIVDLADTTKERNEFTTGYDAETGKYTTYYYGGYGLIADTTAADPSGFTLTKGGAEATWSGTYTWSRANAQKNANAFTISTDEAVASASKRTVGDVFYIKEVPSSYLAAPKIATVKADYGAGALTSVSILSVVDTTIYRAGGINGTKGTFASSFTMTQNGGGSSSVTASDLFGLPGYLTVNAWATTEVSNLKLVPFWTTYDNITVNSNSSRTITISGNEVTNAKEAGLE